MLSHSQAVLAKEKELRRLQRKAEEEALQRRLQELEEQVGSRSTNTTHLLPAHAVLGFVKPCASLTALPLRTMTLLAASGQVPQGQAGCRRQAPSRTLRRQRPQAARGLSRYHRLLRGV